MLLTEHQLVLLCKASYILAFGLRTSVQSHALQGVNSDIQRFLEDGVGEQHERLSRTFGF